MTQKTTKRMALILCLVAALTICLTACGSNPPTPASNNTSFTGEKYVNDGSDFAIKTADLPENYTCVPDEQFVAGFKSIVDGTITTSSSYEDVAAAFGDDGIKMQGIAYEGYAYYTWYSDKDYTSDTKVNVLITFKVSGDKTTYYAYSSSGIAPQDVK